MTLRERLQRLASALLSREATVTFTKASLIALLDSESDEDTALTRHLTVDEVAEQVGRSPSTVAVHRLTFHELSSPAPLPRLCKRRERRR